MNASFGTHKTLLLNQSYPPSIMQYNNNINNISPPSNNNNINTINNSVSANIADATSIHNDEGTNTDDSRKVSDRHALPQQQKTIIILQGLNVNVIGLQANDDNDDGGSDIDNDSDTGLSLLKHSFMSKRVYLCLFCDLV
eukprot:22585_1